MANALYNGPMIFDFRADPTHLSKSEINGVRIALAVSGVLAILLGILVVVWPSATITVVAVLFGLYFLLSGIVRAVRGIFTRGASIGMRLMNILFGVLLGVAGIVTIRNPLNSLVILALVIGISWIIEGVGALVETAPDSSKWFGTFAGAIGIIAGVVVLLTPLQSIAVLTLVAGLFLVASGVVQLMQAFTFGRATKASLKAA